MVVRVMGGLGRRVRKSWRRLAVGCALAGLVGLAFCWGRTSAQTVPGQAAAPPAGRPAAVATPGGMMPNAPLGPESRSDYARRVVAYVNKTIPITREDLGEYLIARYGPDKVEALVNHKIVELACQARGIRVSDAEIDAAVAEDLRSLQIVNMKDFETKILRPRNITMYQYREDVLRPKLALTQMCRERVKVTEADVQKAFDNHYGAKVQCRMILIPSSDPGRQKLEIWEKVRKSPEEFDKMARTQAIPMLAARAGEVPPICKHCGADEIEKYAFQLGVGEVSPLIETPDGTVILRCEKHIEADKGKKLADVRAALQKEIYERKLFEEIPKVLKELRAKADPQFFIKRPTVEDIYREVAREVGPQGPGARAESAAPAGK